jgi:hypothetical protein
VNVVNYLTPELHKRVEEDVIKICEALGYDLNTVEFAIRDGVPYAIDFMNPAPDAELISVGEYNHRWIVDSMTDFILEGLKKGFDPPEYRWTAFLNPASQPREKAAPRKSKPKAKTTNAKAGGGTKQARKGDAKKAAGE